MYAIDPENFKAGQPVFLKKKACQNMFYHQRCMVGYVKLIGFQSSEFPLAIYGCVDTASRKMFWLKMLTGDSKSFVPGISTRDVTIICESVQTLE